MHLYSPGVNTPKSRRRLIKVVNGDTLTFTVNVRYPYTKTAISADDTAVPDITVILAENRFTGTIWTGKYGDGDSSVSIDPNTAGLAHVTIPRTVMAELRRGVYTFSVLVSSGTEIETQAVGYIQVEYEATSATHDIPYRSGSMYGSTGSSSSSGSSGSSGSSSSSSSSSVEYVLEYVSLSGFPSSGATGRIYVARDTEKLYRWDGSKYVELSAGVVLGETSETAYAGNKGAANAAAIKELKSSKQDVLTAGSNITIAGSTISATSTDPSRVYDSDKSQYISGDLGVYSSESARQSDILSISASSASAGTVPVFTGDSGVVEPRAAVTAAFSGDTVRFSYDSSSSGSPVGIEVADAGMLVVEVAPSGSDTSMDIDVVAGCYYVVSSASVKQAVSISVELPTPSDKTRAGMFAMRFDGTGLSPGDSRTVEFSGMASFQMGDSVGAVEAGKVSVASFMWNGSAWDVGWANYSEAT